MMEVLGDHIGDCDGKVKFVCDECDMLLCDCQHWCTHECEE